LEEWAATEEGADSTRSPHTPKRLVTIEFENTPARILDISYLDRANDTYSATGSQEMKKTLGVIVSQETAE
jgi:hypothetical protein